MNYTMLRKTMIVSILVFSLLFCCGAAWHTVLAGGSDMSMEGHNACGMGDMGSQAEAGHTYSIVSSILNFFKNILAHTLFVLVLGVVLVTLLCDKLACYFKRTRDRYGGFGIFSYFTTLFRLGILHPKTF